jgi:carboxyl-terminal processing protease
MLPAAIRDGGQAIATPDVCSTPDGTGGSQAIPYTNTATNAQATGYSQIVMISMMNALSTASSIPSSSGDEAGTYSSTKGKTSFTTGDPIVYIEGMPAVELTTPTSQNGTNAVGSVLVPSTTNVFFNYLPGGEATDGARDPWMRPMSAADLEAIHDAMHGRRPIREAMLPGKVGLIAIDLFTPSLPAEVHAAIRRLASDGATALVLDLRGNPGGDMDAAIRLADHFLPRGAIVARVIDEGGDEVIHEARGDRPHPYPIVTIVDGGTASAAELFAGCLQAHDRALVVGERTRGKGAVQAVLPAPDGAGAVYATVARCALPGGDPIEGVGVRPDVEIEAGGAGDPPLDAAWAIALSMT